MERRRLPKPDPRPIVLIVDGHDDTLALYAIALSTMGFDVMAAKDSTEAFRQASEMRPDVIVTELVLRQTNGWELLGSLKGDARTRDIPVVVLTGYAQSSVHERARREGCTAFLVKPCLPDRLAVELRDLLVHHSPTGYAPASSNPFAERP